MRILIWVIKVSREIESLHWATLHAIRRFFNKINLTKLTRFLIPIVSAMQVCAYRMCACSKVRFSRNNLPQYEIFIKDIILKSDGRISHKHDAFYPEHIFLLKIAANICRGALSMTWGFSFCADIHGCPL